MSAFIIFPLTLKVLVVVVVVHITTCLAQISTDKTCEKYDTKPLTAFERAKMKTWPVPGIENVEGESLYGFSYVFKKIYEHQNPVDCKTAKFIVYPGYESGFGSSIRVEANYLAVALDIGRVLIEPPMFDPDNNAQSLWRFYNPLCQIKNSSSYLLNMYCYYEPYTSCSYQDIFPDYDPKDPVATWDQKNIPIYKYSENEIPKSIKDNKNIENVKVVRFKRGYVVTEQLPQINTWCKEIFTCLHLEHWEQTFWWVAVASAYLMRPNRRIIEAFKEYQQFQLQVPCVSTYVRHGDKHAEMSLIGIKNYTRAARYLWQIGVNRTFSSIEKIPNELKTTHHRRHHKKQKNGHLFLGTDDPIVIEDSLKFGKIHNWTIQYTSLLDRGRLSAADKQFDRTKKRYVVKNRGHTHAHSDYEGHHELEYFSILLNIHNMLQCDAFVSTYGSNFNRIVEFLKITVAGKAHRMTVDLEVGRPPLLYTGNYRRDGRLNGYSTPVDFH